jgi:hypothetical protein
VLKGRLGPSYRLGIIMVDFPSKPSQLGKPLPRERLSPWRVDVVHVLSASLTREPSSASTTPKGCSSSTARNVPPPSMHQTDVAEHVVAFVGIRVGARINDLQRIFVWHKALLFVACKIYKTPDFST